MSSIKRLSFVYLISYLILLVSGGKWVWEYSFNSLTRQQSSQLDRFSGHIVNQLDKFAHIPELLSQDKELINALKFANNSAQIEITNRYLQHVNSVIQAADTYLIDQYGTTIAASNWKKERSFVGRNFAFRPYFQEAIIGSESQYFALGSTSGQRGYYYSYPISFAAEVIGVVVVKMDLSSIEKNWQGKQSYFVASDQDHVVFMSSNPNWLFKSLLPLSTERKQEILDSRQYLDTDIQSLNFSGALDTSPTVLTHRNSIDSDGFVMSSQKLDTLPLTIRVLSPKHLIWWDLISYVVILTLVFAVIFLFSQLLHHRRQKHRHIEQLQSEAKQKLEFLVMERTSELHLEIDQRIKTEETLRKTQDDLIQAAKLAVLGQMSASISHELNNPLAAIRSFSENGKLFLSKEKYDRAQENFTRISALTERMAKISLQLKSFAKKSSSTELVQVPLLPILHSVNELIAPQIKTNRVNYQVTNLEEKVEVSVNPIQLEQVLINLITNAIQAMDELNDKTIELTVELSNQHVSIHIDDNGDGISPSDAQDLFAPFYTTKKDGLGLGLSISSQIMSSMNGELSTQLSPLGGARFSVTLPVINNNNSKDDTKHD
ncbi:sensor histidine kinase [Vibrio sp. T187]|uniref:sensor histidine kinase n=1 Tax=Vibrio TaxID=662 RepID=UPI0010C9B8DD|nr:MULTISPECIES: ATP-binding protein [Vibrio]MBW3694525.1 sensor histidine kinase [Vibrio sp. T187]